MVEEIDDEARRFLRMLRSQLSLSVDDVEQAAQAFFPRNELMSSDHERRDRVALLLHLVMLQQNFVFATAGHDSARCLLLDMSQTSGSIYTKLAYNAIADARLRSASNSTPLVANVIVTLLQSGARHLDIHIKHANFISVTLKCNMDQLFAQATTQLDANMFAKLQLEFKDTALNPLKFHLRTLLGNDTSVAIRGLVDMPVEIVFKLCASYLNIGSIVRLGSACKCLRQIVYAGVYGGDDGQNNNSGSLWRCLLARDYPDAFEKQQNAHFYIEYKRLYRRKRFRLY